MVNYANVITNFNDNVLTSLDKSLLFIKMCDKSVIPLYI